MAYFAVHAAALTCGALALADAGVEMFDLMLGVSAVNFFRFFVLFKILVFLLVCLSDAFIIPLKLNEFDFLKKNFLFLFEISVFINRPALQKIDANGVVTINLDTDGTV